jgi:DNA mismatch endonuclease (patch repair protein)
MDVFSAKQRSRIMARIRSDRNRSTELRLIRVMRKNRITGWRRNDSFPAENKIRFPEQAAVWHGNPDHFCMPKSNRSYWRIKILGNKLRDRHISKAL